MKKSWLFGKTVIITGASGGLGLNIARLLISLYNCKVIGVCRSEQRARAAAESLGTLSANFSYRLFDVAVKENWKEFSHYLEENGIVPDILINNAGFMLPFKKFEHISEEEAQEITATNFSAVVTGTAALIPAIKKSQSPAIINVASAAGLTAVVGESMYCATKFAVRGFTETLIQEYLGKIYVAGVYPGFIRTDILRRMTITDKENRLISRLMMPAEKAAKKIVRGIAKRKKRMVMGVDGRSMWFFSRLFPRLTPRIITKVLKISGLDMFSEVFGEETENTAGK